MTYRSLEQGIQAIKDGKLVEGRRLLKIALKSGTVHGHTRTTALLWLAEATEDRETKLGYYREVLAIEPDNAHANQRLGDLLASDLPGRERVSPPPVGTPIDGAAEDIWKSSPPPGAPERPDPPAQSTTADDSPTTAQPPNVDPNALFRTIGILDGANGVGSGFFLTRDGLAATTRFVVGGSETVTYELNPGQRGQAQVVRSFPEFDLAFLQTGIKLGHTLPISQSPTLPADTPITAFAHYGGVIGGRHRPTRQVVKAGWFPTDIDQAPDAGGNPVFSQDNVLVGMLTLNANRAVPYVFVLHVSMITRLLERFTRERHNMPGYRYCPSCGHLSRAALMGGFYCETCGAVYPESEGRQRFPMPSLMSLYGETRSRPCVNCGSSVGYYKGECLRCGYQRPR